VTVANSEKRHPANWLNDPGNTTIFHFLAIRCIRLLQIRLRELDLSKRDRSVFT